MLITKQNSFNIPVLFLIFNRKEVTKQVFEQIRKIRPKYLYVAADGPRANKVADKLNCEETRAIINQIDWDCELKTLFRNNNLGCGPAVASAIDWFFDNVEEGIILEDDCFPDLSFFSYCKELLEKYRNTDIVKFIGGNNFQNGNIRGNESYYFSRYPTSWGWAGWRRSWKLFNHDISEAKQSIQDGNLNSIFNSKQEKEHWKNSLEMANTDGKGIWDFHFYYAIWKNNGYCITPNKNLVINLGFFDGGTHYFLKDSTKTNPKCETISIPLIHPNTIEINKEADKYTFHHFYSHSIQRAIRIFRENDLTSIFRYFKNKF